MIRIILEYIDHELKGSENLVEKFVLEWESPGFLWWWGLAAVLVGWIFHHGGGTGDPHYLILCLCVARYYLGWIFHHGGGTGDPHHLILCLCVARYHLGWILHHWRWYRWSASSNSLSLCCQVSPGLDPSSWRWYRWSASSKASNSLFLC